MTTRLEKTIPTPNPILKRRRRSSVIALVGIGLFCSSIVAGYSHCIAVNRARDEVIAAGGRVALSKAYFSCPAWIEDNCWPLLREVDSVDLAGVSLSQAVIRSVGKIKPRRLDFTGCALTADLLGELPHLPHLNHLNLTKSQTTDFMLETVFSRYPNLEVLGLGQTHIGDAGLASIGKCQQIKVLDLSGTEVTDEAARLLMHLKNLRSLVLSTNTRVGDAGVLQLSDSPSLEILNLSATHLTNKGVAPLANMSALKTLNISRTSVSGPCLAPLLRLNKLKSLAVDGTSAHFEADRQTVGLRQLSHLSLRKCRIGAAHIQTLAQCSQLQSLDLDECDIHDAEFLQLSRLSSIRWISARQTPLTDRSVNDVTSRCPSIKVRLGVARAQNVIRVSDMVGDLAAKSGAYSQANGVLLLFEQWFGQTPPLGARPIAIELPKGTKAFLEIANTAEYSIWLGCLNNEFSPQEFIRQFSHELGHVWLRPPQHSAFAEAICIALSYITLEETGHCWTNHYLSGARSFASAFNEEADHLRAISLSVAHLGVTRKSRISRLPKKPGLRRCLPDHEPQI